MNAGAQRVRLAFTRANEAGRAAFVAYVLAGFRDGEESLAVAKAALDGGADLLEIGVPFSDPMADGPVIAEAGRTAVAAGAGLDTARMIVRGLREAGYQQPLLIMTYRNPLRVAGDDILDNLKQDGLDGLILPDLPAGEEPLFEQEAATVGLALTFLVAPNTSPQRVEAVIASSTGFMYIVPRYGVTGSAEQLAAGAVQVVQQMRERTAGRLPVAAGFGISKPSHVAALRDAADGLIIGTVMVATVSASEAAETPAMVRDLIEDLVAATKR